MYSWRLARRCAPLAWAPALLLAGCGGLQAGKEARPSLLEPVRERSEEVSPAYWVYHPRRAARLAARYELGARRQLLVGNEGERWLVAPGVPAQPASELAPEALVGALSRGESSWVFVGESGAIYQASTPLGEFVSASAPLTPFVKAVAGRNNILSISADARLMTSTDAGLSWQAAGPNGARFVDVLLQPPYAIALELPEQLWWSGDEGKQWQTLGVPAFGARGFGRDLAGSAFVDGTLEARAIDFQNPPTLRALARRPEAGGPELEAEPLQGPSADALAAGRAFFADGRYFEILLGAKAHSLSGDLATPLERRSLDELAGCTDVKLAGMDAWVYLACSKHTTSGTRLYEFFRSQDAGRRFEREPYVARGNPDKLKLAVSAQGTLLVAGLCAAGVTLASCHTQGVQRRTELASDAGVQIGLQLVPTPALDGDPLALGFSTNGKSAYMVGQRTKSDGLFVFVSNDAGAHFGAQALNPLEQISGLKPTAVDALTAAKDGHVSLVLSLPGGQRWLAVLDAEARSVTINLPPVQGASIGAYGARALALGQDDAWESLSGGADWQPIGKPPASLCRQVRQRCVANIFCQAEGCALGSSLSRVGWKGQRRSAGALLLPPPAAPAALKRRATARGFSCDLGAGGWRQLAGVVAPPGAAQAALGRAEWFVLASDDATASASLWVASYGDRLSVARSPLLAESPRARDFAYYPALQVEGAAALRYPVSTGSGAPLAKLVELEVAWENLFEARRGHAKVDDAGPLAATDFGTSRSGMHRAKPDLLSIAAEGIYVRPHAAPGHEQPTLFLDGKAQSLVPALAWDSSALHGARAEMARVNGSDLPLLLIEGGSRVIRAERRENRWQLSAMTLGFEQPERFDLAQSKDISYLGSDSGLLFTTRFGAEPAEAFFYAFRASGAVVSAGVRLASQADLGDPAQACSALERKSRVRVVSPYQPGRRRPVVVHDAVDPERLMLTGPAVVYGTPGAACVASFEAEPVRAGRQELLPERALIGAGSDSRSWLFRFAPESSQQTPILEYRSMACRYDAELTPPAELYSAPGTSVDG